MLFRRRPVVASHPLSAASTYTTPAFPSNNIILWNRSTKLLQFQDKQKNLSYLFMFDDFFRRCSQIQGFVISAIKSIFFNRTCNYFVQHFRTLTPASDFGRYYIHRQRPKHAQKLHRPAVFLDESEDGARSFETKTTLTVLNSTSFFLESGQTIVRKLKTCIYVWKFLTILCHFTNNVFLSNFHCFCSFPCQNLDFFNSLQLMYRNLPR